jgi:ATP-binding cassette, subfamily B, bacterial MsbA
VIWVRWSNRNGVPDLLKLFRNSENIQLLRRLFRENFRKQSRNYLVAIAAMLVVAATTALSAWIMRDVVNELVVTRNLPRIYLIAAIVALIFILKGAAVFVQTWFLGRAGNAIVADQQKLLYDRILGHGLEFFHSFPSGDLITRMTQNAAAARDILNMLVTSGVRDLLSLLGLLAVMVIQQPWLSLAAFLIAPPAIFGVSLLVKRVKKVAGGQYASLAEIVRIMQETIFGIKVVKSFNLEDRLRTEMHAAVTTSERLANRIALLGAGTSPLMETLGGLAIAGVIVVAGYLTANEGQTPGELMSFITALLLAYEPAKRLARLQISLESGLAGVRMMFALSDRPYALTDSVKAKPLKVTAGKIKFADVSFGYSEGIPVLRRINFTAAPGKVTALVGASGGGKSTVMNLILRLYDPDKGVITIDGQDIRNVPAVTLREAVAYVSQDTFLFAGTVRDNIAMGAENASAEAVVEAAKAAHAHDFIVTLGKGYDTQVGENGVALSGGQKQRIAIARALLKNAPIILLDEPTSALDAGSEQHVKIALETLLKGRTAIVIAHRLSTIRSADVICVIQEGRVVESGTHAELMGKESFYAVLHDIQFAA